jgi:hypothetical protein
MPKSEMSMHPTDICLRWVADIIMRRRYCHEEFKT